MGVGQGQREDEVIRAGLTRWLRARQPDAENLLVTSLTRPTAGLSSETYIVTIASDSEPAASMVVRLPPLGGGLFATYDLAFQGRLQANLAELGIPAASPIAYEGDASWLGAPFLAMPHIAGRLAEDNPPYFKTGWLHDSTAELQAAVYTGFVDVLADIHRLDWRAASPAWAAPGSGPHLVTQVAWWSDYLAWASAGDPPGDLEAALGWCRSNLPDPEPAPSLQWGDVRLGNVIFGDDGAPAAVLDWEMAGIGPAEVDLGWFFALREMSIPPGGPELPGFLDRAATLARYQARLGREVADLWWYELFALVRSTAILVRMQRLLAERGETDHWLTGFDPVPARIKTFVGSR